MLTCNACCRYEVAKKKGDYDEETMKREHAKNALERYMHYYQVRNKCAFAALCHGNSVMT